MSNQRLAQLAAYGRIKVALTDNRVGIADLYHATDSSVSVVFSHGTDGWHSVYEVRPYLRPMSNLDKPIVVEGYNNSEPFVPISILALLNPHLSFTQLRDTEVDNIVLGIMWDMENDFCIHEITPIIDLLNLWQFDYRGWIEQGLAVELKEE